MFNQSAMRASNSMLVWWGGNTRKSDAKRLNRLVRKAGSVVGTELESLTSATIMNRLLSIMDNDCQPFHNKVSRQRDMFSSRLLWPAQETGYEGPLFCAPFSSTMLQQKGSCELNLFAWVHFFLHHDCSWVALTIWWSACDIIFILCHGKMGCEWQTPESNKFVSMGRV